MTNEVCLGGHVMVPNLDYKKDTFLELSLISNFLSYHWGQGGNYPVSTW